MSGIIVWLQANWVQLLTVLLVVDQLLIGIFPSVAIFGSIKDIVGKLLGNPPPPALK